MRLGIVGSRTFTDFNLMEDCLSEAFLEGFDVVISGGADGADSMAARIAKRRNVLVIEHLPDRERFGWPAAAFIRNSLIVDDSEALMAFFGPNEPPSVNKSGTMDTVRKAIAKRIPVHLYFEQEEAK